MLLLSPAAARSKLKNVLLWYKLWLNPKKRAEWKLYFDPIWYAKTHRDVARSGVTPALHYLLYGHLEGRIASPDFDAAFYLRRHPDVRIAGVNPLLHFVLFGSGEQRTAAPPAPALASVALHRLAPLPAPQPLISVVIPCFNYGRYLEEAIASVHAQTFCNWELIIVEGGSTDGETPAIVRRLDARNYPNTRFFYRPEPHLVGDNRNFGIGHARGKYVCCLDADDLLKPTYLEAAAFLAETHGYDLVYPSVQCFGESDSKWLLSDAGFPGIADHNQVSTIALFRRSVWESVGGYRDWGKGDTYVAEDWDFWLRIVCNGWSAKSIKQPLMLYRVHKSGLWHPTQNSVARQRAVLAECNAELIASEPKPRRHAEAAGWARLAGAADDRPAILLALPFLAIGGAERVFETIVKALQEKGYRVVIVTTLVLAESIEDNTPYFESLTPHVYALPQLLDLQEDRWPELICYLLVRYRVELILIAGCDFVYHLLPELRRAFPEAGVVDQLFNDQVHFPTNRHYAPYIDVTMVPSEAFAARAVREFGEHRERLAVIPHGVGIPSLPEASTADEVWERSGLPASFRGRFLVGFFGRLSPEKAPGDFIEIARSLAADPSVHFIMTGDGPERKRVMELINRCRLSERIHAPGFVENPHDLMALADVVVVPSRLDGMPLVVMEAQALGKPVVASSVGSIPAMIADGETGLLCAPGDIAAFVRRIRELRKSPDEAGSLGLRGRRSVEAHHSAEAMTSRYFEAFERARRRARERCAPADLESITAGASPT